MTELRAPEVEPFLRGVTWPAGAGCPYPRADPADDRLPRDTWACATVPVGVRLEVAGPATAIDVDYRAEGGPDPGGCFTVWKADREVDRRPAVPGEGRVRLSLGAGPDPAVVYLPERMRPVITGISGVDGAIEAAPGRPRWVAYGDSITEGWVAGDPAATWLARAGRREGFDTVNLGYAGSARGELASAEQVAAIRAEVVSVAFGTNCWSRLPFTTSLMAATTDTFVRTIRSGHPDVPIVVVSPIVRPDAERQPNRVGATLADLRRAQEEAVEAIDDERLTLVPGRELIGADLLADGIHPGPDGHLVMAEVVGPAVRSAYLAANPAMRPG